MLNYKTVKYKNYLPEHFAFVERFKSAINLISFQSNDIMGIKDVDSQHLVCSKFYANIVGLKSTSDVVGRSDFDMPCKGTAEYADQYVKEDQSLINNQKIDSVISILNVHNYNDGLKARIFKKRLLVHEETKSILGTVYSGHDVELKNFINIIPNYIIQFGALGNNKDYTNDMCTNENNVQLNDYEKEICFLLLLNWDFKQIAEFMNTFRPDNISRTADTIIKKRNYICQKLRLNFNTTKDLCEYLVSIGFHNKMPTSFYSRIIGSKVLSEESITI